MTNVAEAARRALGAGIAVVPPREDGTKAPIGETWGQYQKVMPTTAEVDIWWGNHQGIGVITGAISGNLEMLEFETEDIWQEYLDKAREWNLDSLVFDLNRNYFEATPGGGYHLFYRCEKISGNLKLANGADKRTLIETRGEGGFAIVAPTSGSVHPTGRPYILLSGGFDSIVTITPEEREALHSLARQFDQSPKLERLPPRPVTMQGDRLGDIFNAQATWEEVLEPHGWRLVRMKGHEGFWRRPGKDIGISATTDYADSDLLKVFSSSTDFNPECSYSKFAAYAVLEHGGDFSAAAIELRMKGYRAPEVPRVNLSEPATPGRFVLKPISEVKQEKVEFLWYPRIPRGKLTMVSGDPGLGKSEMMLQLAAEYNLKTVYISAEDSASDTLKPRYKKLGGNEENLFIMESPEEGRLPDLGVDLLLLDNLLNGQGFDMLVLDPLNAFLPGIDIYKDNQVRGILGPLSKMAEKHRLAVIPLRHLVKNSGENKAIYRGQASIGFTGAARSEMLVEWSDERGIRLLRHIKSNVGPLAQTLAFTIKPDPFDIQGAPLFEWLGVWDEPA